MRLNYRIITLLALCIAQPWLTRTASAVVKADLPVSKRYEVCKSILVGKVTAVNPDLRGGRCHHGGQHQGNRRAAGISRADHQSAGVDQVGGGGAAGGGVRGGVFGVDPHGRHLAAGDADSRQEPPIWRANQQDPRQSNPSFPGTTASLARVLEEKKAGKYTLLDAFDGKIFPGGAKEIAKLEVVKPTFLLSVDVNGDGKPDLLVGSAQGVKLFLATAGGYADATAKWGLGGVSGTAAAAGDVNGDGKPDLLIDKTLYLNDGQKFTAAPQAIAVDGTAPVLASSLGDFTGAGKIDAALLLNDGRLLVFKNAGQAAWAKEVDRKLIAAGPLPQAAVFGEFAEGGTLAVIIAQDNALTRFPVKSDEPPADFARLTGGALDKFKGFAGGLKNATLTRLDVNGDHRPDLLLTIDGASLVLANRGFGAFFPDPDAAADFNARWRKGTAVCAGRDPCARCHSDGSGGSG